LPRKDLFNLEELASPASCNVDEEQRSSALRPVLRSKGFCWIDSEPLKQHIWAHAGKTLSVVPADWWWAALDKEQLKFKVTYPGVEAEFKMTRKEKWDKDVGDRRQELVFIGGAQMREKDIVDMLEACLLSDVEYDEFRERTKGLRVPDDDFHVNGLLKNLGASENEIKELNRRGDSAQEAKQLARRADREDTHFLRSLGVGDKLDEEEGEENAEVANLRPPATSADLVGPTASSIVSSATPAIGVKNPLPTHFEPCD